MMYATTIEATTAIGNQSEVADLSDDDTCDELLAMMELPSPRQNIKKKPVTISTKPMAFPTLRSSYRQTSLSDLLENAPTECTNNGHLHAMKSLTQPNNNQMNKHKSVESTCTATTVDDSESFWSDNTSVLGNDSIYDGVVFGGGCGEHVDDSTVASSNSDKLEYQLQQTIRKSMQQQQRLEYERQHQSQVIEQLAGELKMAQLEAGAMKNELEDSIRSKARTSQVMESENVFLNILVHDLKKKLALSEAKQNELVEKLQSQHQREQEQERHQRGQERQEQQRREQERREQDRLKQKREQRKKEEQQIWRRIAERQVMMIDETPDCDDDSSSYSNSSMVRSEDFENDGTADSDEAVLRQEIEEWKKQAYAAKKERKPKSSKKSNRKEKKLLATSPMKIPRKKAIGQKQLSSVCSLSERSTRSVPMAPPPTPIENISNKRISQSDLIALSLKKKGLIDKLANSDSDSDADFCYDSEEVEIPYHKKRQNKQKQKEQDLRTWVGGMMFGGFSTGSEKNKNSHKKKQHKAKTEEVLPDFDSDDEDIINYNKVWRDHYKRKKGKNDSDSVISRLCQSMS